MSVIREFLGTRLCFRYFFNAGFDRQTCECDVEGSDVYEVDESQEDYDIIDTDSEPTGHYLGTIKWRTPTDIEGMEDDELEDLLLLNDIII